jgi:hypothetical protein
MKKNYLPFMMMAFLAWIFLMTCKSDSMPNSQGLLQVNPWPEADLLFRTNPKWIGSDCAYSIDLGNKRVLWLFGDSVIAASKKNIRRQSVMIRNSVGIQSG